MYPLTFSFHSTLKVDYICDQTVIDNIMSLYYVVPSKYITFICPFVCKWPTTKGVQINVMPFQYKRQNESPKGYPPSDSIHSNTIKIREIVSF